MAMVAVEFPRAKAGPCEAALGESSCVIVPATAAAEIQSNQQVPLHGYVRAEGDRES